MKSTPKAPVGAQAGAGRGGSAVTLETVAKTAGVSSSTASRILNGTAVVSEAKRKAVAEAIAALGFIPNPVARGLAGGRTLSIGVVTQAIDSPFYGTSLCGIEDELALTGLIPLFVTGHWNAAEEGKSIEALRARRVDGIIVLTGRLTDQALKVYAKALPVVVTGRTLKAPGLFALKFNDFEGGLLATQHLIEGGHRRIALITGSPEHPDANERLRGYRAALEAAGISFDPALVVQGNYQEVSGLAAVDDLLHKRQHFTAIFATNDQMAAGAALGLYRRSLRIPDDVSLVGFDDLPGSQYMIPPLTTVRQPSYELGRLAASAMTQLLSGVKPAITLPQPKLIARESTHPLPR